MATCNQCGRSGWFLKVRSGLCDQCYEPVVRTVLRAKEIFDESLELVNNSKNLNTRLGRCDTALEQLDRLEEYEHLEFVSMHPDFQTARKELAHHKVELVREHLEEKERAARERIETLSTTNAKANQFNKLKQEVRKFEEILGDTVVEELIGSVDKSINEIRIGDHLEKAKKAEFKGKGKKALDEYYEALYILRTDDVLDDEQHIEISEIEARIEDLGGEIPGKV